MKKKLLAISFVMLVLLSGCSSRAPITSDSTGIWDHYFVYPVSKMLTVVADFFQGDYGIAIIVVTIFIRILILPVMLKQFKSTMGMQEIAPEMKKLQEKYKSKDAATQQKLQKETMGLYQKHGVNPAMGCLPILIQMPIIMALYNGISRTVEISKHSFLWFQLGHPDPYFILPVLAALTTFISMKITMSGGSTPTQPGMAMMPYISPFFILVAAFQFPSAMSLYWVVGGVFAIGQSLYFKSHREKINAAKGITVSKN